LRTYILWFRAWSLYRLGRLAEATEGFERLAGFGNDIVAGKAWYWLGRSAVTMKKPEAAEAWYRKVVDRYPLSYYGMLSLRALGEMGTTSANPLLDEEALPELERPLPGQADRYLSPSLKERMGPVLDAVLLGEVRAARRWFEPLESAFDRDVRERSAEAHYWLLSLLEEPQKMREWGRRNKRQRGRQPDAENRLGWAFEFPQAYLRLIEVQAARTGLPEVFLYSIMRQESRYRRGVVSWADAVGLLQVIPPTGSRTAQRLGISFDRAELPQPEVNIRLGSSYLGFLARDFHTQLTLVAASYNAGPQPIREFVNANADGGWDYLVEEIAYNEARNYCRKVTGHVLKYLATYAPAAERRRVFALLFPDPPRFDVGEDVTW
jgi:soluble lytic murein transglycosylase